MVYELAVHTDGVSVRPMRVQMMLFEEQLWWFRQDTGRYPTAEEGLGALRVPPADLCELWKGPYIEKGIPADLWGNRYRYNVLDGMPWIRSAGADGVFGTGDDVSNLDRGHRGTVFRRSRPATKDGSS